MKRFLAFTGEELSLKDPSGFVKLKSRPVNLEVQDLIEKLGERERPTGRLNSIRMVRSLLKRNGANLPKHTILEIRLESGSVAASRRRGPKSFSVWRGGFLAWQRVLLVLGTLAVGFIVLRDICAWESSRASLPADSPEIEHDGACQRGGTEAYHSVDQCRLDNLHFHKQARSDLPI